MPARTTGRRVIELGVEVLIALALVAAVLLYARFGPFRWMPSPRWWGLAAMTAVLLWYAVRRYRRYWRRRSFWLTIACLTAVHLVAWSLLLAHVTVWGMAWFVPGVLAEVPVLILALEKLGYHLVGGRDAA